MAKLLEDDSLDLQQAAFVAFFGDLQPANFLAVRGADVVGASPRGGAWELSGFLDYENAAFRDILLGLAKYKTHDLHPLNKAGVVDAWLASRGVPEPVFSLRVAIWCLRTLAKEVQLIAEDGDGLSEEGEHDGEYRDHLLTLLRSSLEVCVGLQSSSM